MPASTRQLAAIMFTDMVGYTALMQQNEQLAIEKRDRHKKIFESSLSKHHGKLLQYYGDGTLSIFSSAVNAVKSAIEIQTLYLREPKIEVRIGIHTGDVMFDDTGVYGDSVNVASRIESLAVPGSIFISEKLFDEIRNQGIDAKPLGYFELKNVQQPMVVYAVSNPGVIVPSREDVKGKVKQTLNSIAILPFASLSSDPENEFFCDGITEELLNVLAKIDGLQVTSRTSSFAFKGKHEDVRDIAAKLNVQKILEGSVRKAGNKVRITAQLVNAADGYHIWSETYERNLEDIFALQDDISREIANKCRLNLRNQEHVKELIKAPTENMEAYKKFLEGIYLWNTQVPENIQPAMNAFHEATRLDPKFAAPYSYIAFLYFFMWYGGIMPPKEAIGLCRDAALKAMEIDPNDSQALLALGTVQLAEFDWQGSKSSLEKSIAHNPNSPLGYIMLASYHFLMLEHALTEEYIEKGHRLDPLGAFTCGMVAEFFNLLNKPDKAIKVCDESLKVNPSNPYLLLMRYMAEGISGKWNIMIGFLEEARKQYGDFPNALGYLGMAYARIGEIRKAEEIIQLLLQLETQQPGIFMDQVALIYGNLLRKDEFFQRLTLSVGVGSAGVLWYYKTLFIPGEISRDKRFIEIRKEVKMPV